jgi:hypothetical protein
VYFYHRFNENGRTRCVYVASGRRALALAREAEQRRAEKEIARYDRQQAVLARRRAWEDEKRRRPEGRAEVRAFREWLHAEDAVLDGLVALADQAMALGGWHRRKRQWCERRTMNDLISSTAAPPATQPPIGSPEHARLMEWTRTTRERLSKLATAVDVRDFETILSQRPAALIELLGADLASRLEDVLVLRAHGDQPGAGRAAHAMLAAMREGFAGDGASPLVRALATVATLCWYDFLGVSLKLQGMRHAHDAEIPPPHPAPDFSRHALVGMEHRADRSLKRFNATSRTLAAVQQRMAGSVRVRVAARSEGGTAEAAVEIERDSSLLPG